MKLQDDHTEPRTLPRLLGLPLLCCALAHAEVQVQLTTVPTLRDLPVARAVLTQIHNSSLRVVQDGWEQTVLGAAERSFRFVLTPPLGPLVGIKTLVIDGQDVLLANWQTGSPRSVGIQSFWVWDTPDYTWLLMRCDPAKVASARTTEDFLGEVLHWGHTEPSPLILPLQYTSTPGQLFLAGSAHMSAAYRGRTYAVAGVRFEAETYLLITVGKLVLSSFYPDDAQYVPERFPPLKERIATWSKEEILSQTSKMWSKTGAISHNSNRDEILIRAAADRGLSSTDLERLLLPSSPPDELAWEQRSIVVMRELARTNQLDRNHEALEDITLRLGQKPEAGAFALQAIFHSLRQSAISDYGDLALRCLATCFAPDAPLKYLAERGNSAEAYAKVKNAVLPASLQGLQREVLEKIRLRLDKK